MNPIVRMLLVGVIVASFAAIVAIVVRDHARPHSAHVNAVVAALATSPATMGPDHQPVSNYASITTITAASPSSPLTDPNPGAEPTGTTGKPASFWALTVTYPTYCNPGTSVRPVLFWNAADTDTVAVSVDSPTTVGGDGFFDSIGTLTMPSIACIGVKGDALPTHEYEIDAFGTDHTRLRVVLNVNVTVSPNLVRPEAPVPAGVAHPTAKQAV